MQLLSPGHLAQPFHGAHHARAPVDRGEDLPEAALADLVDHLGSQAGQNVEHMEIYMHINIYVYDYLYVLNTTIWFDI